MKEIYINVIKRLKRTMSLEAIVIQISNDYLDIYNKFNDLKNRK